MPIASLHNVTTHYGAQAVLKGASFEVNPGQKLGLIGANGSGKTTILRVLLGQRARDRGLGLPGTPAPGSATCPSTSSITPARRS